MLLHINDNQIRKDKIVKLCYWCKILVFDYYIKYHFREIYHDSLFSNQLSVFTYIFGLYLIALTICYNYLWIFNSSDNNNNNSKTKGTHCIMLLQVRLEIQNYKILPAGLYNIAISKFSYTPYLINFYCC